MLQRGNVLLSGVAIKCPLFNQNFETCKGKNIVHPQRRKQSIETVPEQGQMTDLLNKILS